MVPASHFNDETGYALWRNGHEKQAAHEMHGHDFEVIVDAEAISLDDRGFVIDDEAASAIIAEWQHRNLSVHPDFGNERATTERMCEVLIEKFWREGLLSAHRHKRVTVTVKEGSDRVASVTEYNIGD